MASVSADEATLPDFLGSITPGQQEEDLLGQDDLPASLGILLKDVEQDMQKVEHVFALGDRLTEKLAERKVRLTQHYFARAVIENAACRCVFCGFEPRSLPGRCALLRASHIKPWARSTPDERIDVRNGLAACPLHDVAFDQGYLTVNEKYQIYKARLLQESIANDPGVEPYFGEILHPVLLLPERAKRPAAKYLVYHQEHIFKG